MKDKRSRTCSFVLSEARQRRHLPSRVDKSRMVDSQRCLRILRVTSSELIMTPPTCPTSPIDVSKPILRL